MDDTCYRSCDDDNDYGYRSLSASRVEVKIGSIVEPCIEADTANCGIGSTVVYTFAQVIKLEGECQVLPIPQLAEVLLSVLTDMFDKCDNGVFHIGSKSHGTKVKAVTITKTSSNIDICDLSYEDFIKEVGEAAELPEGVYKEIMKLVQKKVNSVPQVVTPEQRKSFVINFFKKALEGYKQVKDFF